MDHARLQQLSDKLDQLINRNRQLEAENTRLRQLQEDWQQERIQLMQKNDHARHKVEAMISRLRALEQH